jgi:ABC-2 type transport system ATP-binding protein
MIRLDGVTKSYGNIPALRDISLRIPAGTITAIAGEDGAGKSTLLKSIVGLVGIDAGRILFKGEPVSDGFRGLRRATGFMPEKFSLYPDLTVSETLDFVADIHGLARSARESRKAALLQRTELAGFKNRRAGALSGGMRQKLALITAMIHGPELLILDEPTTGIDPLSRGEILQMVSDLKSEGQTIIWSTSDLEEAENADEFLYLWRGRSIVAGNVLRLKQDHALTLEDICLLSERQAQGASTS